MRIAFLGAGAIALQCLESLNNDYQDTHQLVAAVVSDEMQSYFNEHGKNALTCPALQIDKSKRNEHAVLDLLSATRPDILISVQYPWILSEAVITLMQGYILNLHNAALPDYRGHHSLSYEILNNETTHTCTLHWIAEEVDRGTLQASRSIAIQSEDTAYSLWLRSRQACVELFLAFLNEAECSRWQPTRIPIKGGGTYYARGGMDEAKRIPDTASMATISRYARAFYFPPFEPAFFVHNDVKHYVLPQQFNYVLPNENASKTPDTKRSV